MHVLYVHPIFAELITTDMEYTILEVEIFKGSSGELYGAVVNMPGVVCSHGKTEKDLADSLLVTITETIESAKELGWGDHYKEFEQPLIKLFSYGVGGLGS